MQLGEPITDPAIFVKQGHDTSTCPWHAKGENDSKPMDPQDEDEDKKKGGIKAGQKKQGMPENDGGKLGDNLLAAKNEPLEVRIELYFVKEGAVTFRDRGKDKEMVLYIDSHKKISYGSLQFAAHHLVPGNESLKLSAIFPYLGDANTIGGWKGGKSSKIKEGSCKYDVNCAENGEWLPSPYAISMNDGNSPSEWPGEKGMKAARRLKGEEVYEVQDSFKQAYAKEAVTLSNNRQFHMRHADYSNAVKKHLGSIEVKMMSCPYVDSKQDKFDPPMGLPARLNVLSSRMRGLLTGAVWHEPFFVDEINETIATSKNDSIKYKVSDDEKVI